MASVLRYRSQKQLPFFLLYLIAYQIADVQAGYRQAFNFELFGRNGSCCAAHKAKFQATVPQASLLCNTMIVNQVFFVLCSTCYFKATSGIYEVCASLV